MNKQELVEGLLFAGFRLMATGLVIAGCLSLLIQLADSWYRFDPNYLGSWLTATLLRPLLIAATGALLYGFSATLARVMAARSANRD